MIEAIGTYLPPWGTDTARQPGDDEDVVTMAVAAGLQVIGSAPETTVTRVVLVSRELPLLEGGNSAALLAGLSLPATVEVREELGGAPAALEAVGGAAPGTLVIGADIAGSGRRRRPHRRRRRRGRRCGRCRLGDHRPGQPQPAGGDPRRPRSGDRLRRSAPRA